MQLVFFFSVKAKHLKSHRFNKKIFALLFLLCEGCRFWSDCWNQIWGSQFENHKISDLFLISSFWWIACNWKRLNNPVQIMLGQRFHKGNPAFTGLHLHLLTTADNQIRKWACCAAVRCYCVSCPVCALVISWCLYCVRPRDLTADWEQSYKHSFVWQICVSAFVCRVIHIGSSREAAAVLHDANNQESVVWKSIHHRFGQINPFTTFKFSRFLPVFII